MFSDIDYSWIRSSNPDWEVMPWISELSRFYQHSVRIKKIFMGNCQMWISCYNCVESYLKLVDRGIKCFFELAKRWNHMFYFWFLFQTLLFENYFRIIYYFKIYLLFQNYFIFPKRLSSSIRYRQRCFLNFVLVN